MAYALIGREDIATTAAPQQQPSSPSAVEPPPVGAGGPPALTPSTPQLEATPAGRGPSSSKRQRHGSETGGAAADDAQRRARAERRQRRRPPTLVLPYVHRLQLPALSAGAAAAPPPAPGKAGGAAAPAPGDEGDGLDGLDQPLHQLRFGRDDRLAEVRRLMGSAAARTLKVDATENDPELQAKQQAALLALAARTLALPLGRGAVALGTLRPLPGEALRAPPLCLSAVTGEAPRCVVALDLSAATAAPGGGAAAELTAWPEFHNGVATGLRLAPPPMVDGGAAAGGGGGGDGNRPSPASLFDRAWVTLAKQEGPSYAHAGLLMALGLRGRLEQLTWTDLYT
jgi:anaphase-promoting complex subunit 1